MQAVGTGGGAGVRKPRKEETAGEEGAVWLGAIYGDLRIADGSPIWRWGPKAAGVIVGSRHDGLFLGRGCGSELSWCAEHDTGVIVYSPMQAGLLTGTFTAARAMSLPANDWRTQSPDFSGDALQRNMALADALKPIADRHGVTQGAVAAAWALAWPGVTAAIIGARKPTQVDGWISVATLELTPADLKEVADAIAVTGAGFGPSMPALKA